MENKNDMFNKTPKSGKPPDFITFLRHHIAHNDNQRVT